MAQSKWTDQWPEKEGMFWVYGWPHGDPTRFVDEAPKPDLRVLKVRRAGGKGNRFWMYIADGGFVYEKSAGPCLFLEMEVPSLPELELPEKAASKGRG